MKVKTIMFFPNGNMAVLDEQGGQIPQLQQSWLLQILDSLVEKGGEGVYEAQIILPDSKTAIPYRVTDGWNWEVKGR